MASNLGNQYAPPKSVVADAHDEGASPLAGRVSRLLAVWLDGLIGFSGFLPAWIKNFSSVAQQSRGNAIAMWVGLAKSGSLFYVGLLIALIVLAVDLTLLARNGQTIGKKLLGIKVVRVDGSPVSLFRVFFLRYVCNTFLALIPLIGVLYSLVDHLMIFGDKRRCAHDYLADTIVIKA